MVSCLLLFVWGHIDTAFDEGKGEDYILDLVNNQDGAIVAALGLRPDHVSTAFERKHWKLGARLVEV